MPKHKEPQSPIKIYDLISNYELVFSTNLLRTDSAEIGLTKMLDSCHSLINCLNTVISNGELRKSPYLVGAMDKEQFQILKKLLSDIKRVFPRVANRVFDNPISIPKINASFWKGTCIEDRSINDAFINMIFQERCGELPLHTHPLSDRVIFIMRGSGFAYFSGTPRKDYNPNTIQRAEVKTGDVLCYPCDTLHTFGTTSSEIELLTYHSTFIPFESDDQYLASPDIWSPNEAKPIAFNIQHQKHMTK